jgi:Leucine-rich repeat (LRR) protein
LGQASVTEISLMENNLNGVIPSILFHLPELRKLNVRNNAVAIGMNAIFQAEKLEELYLDKTRVSTLEGIGQATSLRVLHLHMNSFGWQPIPDEMFDLISLEDLDLSDSMFGGTLSSKVGQLVNLKRLSLVGNAISGQIPDEIGSLGSVQGLDLSGNNWYGTLPTSISGLTSLTRFGLNNVQADHVGITGQLRSFSTMPNLRDLSMSNNQFTGSIPDSFLSGILDTSKQITVYLDGNYLGGVLPSSLVSLQRVNIYLENNLLSGFGSGICQQSQWMDGNVGLYGCDAILCPAGEYSPKGRQVSEDTACALCPDLESSPILGSNFCLSIQKQKEKEILLSLFQGTDGINWKNNDGWTDENVDICNWYGIKCKEGSTIESILLGSNGLVGTVPTAIYTIPNLKFLWLYSNHVDLSFDGIDQATSLTSLLLDSTRIRSLDGLGNCPSLIDVDVRFNNLRGPLPSELSQLVNLESFTCSQNSLSGTVPELEELRKLKILRMGNNAFTGTMPSFSVHPTLVSLDLSDNGLMGPLPKDLLKAVAESSEIFLDLSDNRLTGTVPGDLSRFAQMTVLLRDNRITGINANLCEQTLWNGGDVEKFQCDAIMCPKRTFSQLGRASDEISCRSCSKNNFLGGSTCGGSAASSLMGSATMLLGTAVAITIHFMS